MRLLGRRSWVSTTPKKRSLTWGIIVGAIFLCVGIHLCHGQVPLWLLLASLAVTGLTDVLIHGGVPERKGVHIDEE